MFLVNNLSVYLSLNKYSITNTSTINSYVIIDVLLLNKKIIYDGPTVLLPNNNTIKVLYKGILDLPILSLQFRIVYTFLDIAKLLPSISSTYDAGRSAIFNNN